MISGAKSYDESVLLRLVFARLQDFTLQEAATEVLVAAAHGGEAMMAVIEAWGWLTGRVESFCET